jgi:hypothetical protein
LLKNLFLLFLILITFVILFNGVEVSAEENLYNSFEKDILVGFAQLYYGENNIEGSIEAAELSDKFQERIDFGRVSFFLQGKIKGEYLLTAWLDTEEEKIDELFDNLGERKKSTPFDKIDSEKYYPIYGDNSKVESKVNTAGKLYLALSSEEFEAVWGNYRINYSENELVDLRRSLYGFNLDYNSRFSFDSYLYQPFSMHAQDELEATGGILYYLSRDDLILGSESIKVELRDSDTGRVLESRQLIAGVDYDINYLQGRLILKTDFDQGMSKLIESNDGEDRYYLIADYDYEYDYEGNNFNSFGLESSYDFNDDFKVILNYIEDQNENGEVYKVEAVNIDYDIFEGGNLDIEWAQSENVLSGRYFSNDGGINYQEISLNNTDKAQAVKIDYRQKLLNSQNAYYEAYYHDKDKGFTSGSSYLENDIKSAGFSIKSRNEELESSIAYDLHREKNNNSDRLGLNFKNKLNNKLDLEWGMNYELEKSEAQNISSLITALGLDYKLNENRRLYASQQLTVLSSENAEDNDITTFGGEINADKWRFNTEAKTGDKEGLLFGAAYKINEISEFYTEHEKKFGDDYGTARSFGTSSKLNEDTSIFGEYRVEEDSTELKRTNLLGLDFSPLDNWLFSLDYSLSDVEVSEAKNFDREIIGLGASYNQQQLKTSSRLEYRKDEKSSDLRQIVIKSDLKLKYNEEFTLLSEFEYSKEEEEMADEYLDSTIAFAYRPIDNDRLNFIAKYSYIKEDNYLNYDDREEFGLYPAEKAQVFSADAVYDLNKKWQLGEKIAYKKGEVKLNSLSSEWTDNETYLWVNSLNYQYNENLNLYTEYRILDNNLAEDRKEGFLFGISTRLENDIKLGIGYNFTDFNDDLSDLNYEAEGWFVNLIKAW